MDRSLLDELPFVDELDLNVSIQRPTCSYCARPLSVCVCHAICTDLTVKTNVLILQHPAEQNRQLRTVPLLKCSLPEDKLSIVIGKKFKNLEDIITKKAALLFPGEDAIDCNQVPPDTFDTLICLDGTWPQANRMYQKNKILHSLQKIMVSSPRKSVYLIHTQPTNSHLSTLESVACAIQGMERLDGFEDKLIAPLKEMVRTQFKFGALAHNTQEEAKTMRKQEIKNGSKNLTIAPKLKDFDYDSF